MAGITDTIRHAPRWAWVTVAGLGIGAAGIKLWKGRAAEEAPVEGQVIDDPSAPYPVPTSTRNPAAVIVPPVIAPVTNNNDGGSVLDLHQQYIGAVDTLLGQFTGLIGPLQTSQMALIQGQAQAIQDLAMAGSAPNSNTATPPQVIVYAPPAPKAPKPIGGTAAKTAKCPAAFPHKDSRGCYRVFGCTQKTCKTSAHGTVTKGVYRLYQSGAKVKQ